MQPFITRITRILYSPRGALGLFMALVVGTAAVSLAPQATGGGDRGGADGVTFSGTLSQTGFDHRIGHFRPLRITGVSPKLLFPQLVRFFYLGHLLLGWPTP